MKGIMKSSTNRYGNTFFFTYDEGSDTLNTMRFPEILKHSICPDFPVTMARAMLFEKPKHLKHLRIPVIPHAIQASEQNGNRKQFRDHDNKVTDYVYDDLNRLERLTQAGLGAFQWSYNSAGLPERISYPNGSEANYSYDDANRIDIIDNKQSGVTVTSHDYDYDLNGNRSQLTESNIDVSQITTYTYDGADRLIQVNYPTTINSYTLDKVGNRLTEVIDSAGSLNTKTYTYNNRDQLTAVTDTDGLNVSYGYDTAGNQTEKIENGETTAFDYTARQRVKSITIGASSPHQYQYDYAGQRINAQVNGMEKRYLYDDLTLIAETNAIGNTLATYHYGVRRQLAETRNGQNAYYLADALGTNVAITNQDGSIQNRMDYDVWGNLNQESATSDSPFGFTGYIRDKDTDLYYANQRYYDSQTARFLREDSLQGNPQTPPSLHRYLYAFANPTVYIDPDGRESQSVYSQRTQSVQQAEVRLNKQWKIRKEAIRVKRVKDEQMTRVAESVTNELFTELNIPKDEVLKRAHLSNCVYNNRCNAISLGNIRRANEKDFEDLRINKDSLEGSSGFKAGIFFDEDTDEYIMAFAGTEELWWDGLITDGGQGLGIPVSQYRQARRLAIQLSKGAKRLKKDVSFTGHSLGGGLAAAASVFTGHPAKTFNAAGVHELTLNFVAFIDALMGNKQIVLNPQKQEELIEAYFVKNEVLSRVQDSIILAPDALGKRIPLAPGTSDNFLKQHGSTNVCRSLGSYCDYGEKDR